MKLIKRRGILAVLAFVFIVVVSTSVASVCVADGGGVVFGGDGAGGGGGGGYTDQGCVIKDSYGNVKYYETVNNFEYIIGCSGASWIFYEAVKPTNSDIPFAPYDRRDNGTVVTIDAQCSQHDNGGFWHYGVNVQSYDDTGLFGVLGAPYSAGGPWRATYRATGTNKWGHWKTIRVGGGVPESIPGQAGLNSGAAPSWAWNVGVLGHELLNNSGDVIYRAKEVVLSNDSKLKRTYWTAYKYCVDSGECDDSGVNVDITADGSSLPPIPNGVNYFCYWGGMAVKYYALSNVSNGGSEYHEATGLVSNETAPVEKTTKTREVKTNTDVNLRFSHNIYASAASQEKTNYTLERTGDWNNEGFSIVSGSLNNTSGSVSLDNKVGDLYLPKDSDMVYTNGNNKYLLREDLTVSFSKVGTYTFCESIRLTNSLLSNKLMTKVCAVYEVSPSGPCDMWLPESYFDGKTSVISKVKFYGQSDDEYKDEIYAKPTDRVEWVHCYYPGVQRLASSAGSTNGWGNSFSVIDGNNKKVNVIGSSDEKLIGNYRTGTTTPLTYNGGSYRIGDSSIKYLYDKGSAPTFQGVKVEMRNVGAKITDSLGGGLIEENKSSTPVEKTLDYFDLSLYARDEARVKVPYNFINEIEKVDLSEKVYAGETITLSGVKVYVHTRRNEKLNATYATRVDDAKVKLISYIPGPGGQGSDPIGPIDDISSLCSKLGSSCSDSPEENSSFNKGDDGLKLGSDEMTRVRDDGEPVERSFSLDVNDVAAGTKYCVVAAVYPYTSGGDLNVSPSGDGRWYVSAPSCATVAKRPSLQVWGTGLYTTGSVKTGVAEKTNLGGNKLSGSAVVFGSWVETSIFAGGKVEGLASGAATGFAGSTAKTYKDDADKSFGGSLETNPSSSFCEIRSPLTMPSLACARSSGGSGGSTTSDGDFISRLDAMKNELGDKFKYVEVKSSRYPDGPNGSYLLSNLLTQENRGSNQINGGETLVIDAKNQTLMIDIGATYVSGERYDNLSDIPKLIIRAGDINIDCGVERIDAVLIADRTVNGKMVGKVNTCVDGDGNVPDVNNWRRSNPLKIYGTIIAGSLEANRTFGAGTGEYSVIPAEIIDYDTSLYLWSALTDSTSTGDKLETTYIKELPPRY